MRLDQKLRYFYYEVNIDGTVENVQTCDYKLDYKKYLSYMYKKTGAKHISIKYLGSDTMYKNYGHIY